MSSCAGIVNTLSRNIRIPVQALLSKVVITLDSAFLLRLGSLGCSGNAVFLGPHGIID
jgi:hypothetical protein